MTVSDALLVQGVVVLIAFIVTGFVTWSIKDNRRYDKRSTPFMTTTCVVLAVAGFGSLVASAWTGVSA